MKKLALTVFFALVLASWVQAADALSILPKGTLFFASCDVSKGISNNAFKTFLRDQFISLFGQKETFEQFIKATGLSPEKNLNQFTVFMSSKPDPESKKMPVGYVLTGKFDIAKIQESVIAKKTGIDGLSLGKVEGYTAMMHPAFKTSPMIFIDGSLAIGGDGPAVSEMLGILKNAANSLATEEKFKGMMAKANTKATFWGIGLMPAVAPDGTVTPFAALDFVHFVLEYTGPLHFECTVEIVGPSKERTASAKAFIENLILVIKTQAGESKVAMAILEKAKVEAGDTAVKMTADLDKAQMDSLTAN